MQMCSWICKKNKRFHSLFFVFDVDEDHPVDSAPCFQPLDGSNRCFAVTPGVQPTEGSPPASLETL